MSQDFRMELEVASNGQVSARPSATEFDVAGDDLRAALAFACDALADVPGFKFRVAFAGELWPVDVRTDLLTVLEQLPAASKATGPFVLDFYEQGLERTLLFEPKSPHHFELRCESRHPTWSAPSRVIQIERDELSRMLRSLAQRFDESVARLHPRLAEMPSMKKWRREVLTSQ